MLRRVLVALTVCSLACTTTPEDGEAETSTSEGTAITSAGTSSADGTGDDAGMTGDEGDEATTGTTSDDASTSDGEGTFGENTGETGPESCLGSTGGSGGSPDPWLELINDDMLVGEGSIVRLACGAQGLFMIPLYPYMDGFDPIDATVWFDVIMDVDGFNLNDNGHFFDGTNFGFSVDCAGPSEFVPILVPGSVDAPETMEGAAGRLQLNMRTEPDGEILVTYDFNVTVSAIKGGDDWSYCGF